MRGGKIDSDCLHFNKERMPVISLNSAPGSQGTGRQTCWPTDYGGGSLNVNGTIMRDTYISSLKMFISGTRFSAGSPRLICEDLCKMDGQF